ncbi:unnamed protein product [Caretta caretta]
MRWWRLVAAACKAREFLILKTRAVVAVTSNMSPVVKPLTDTPLILIWDKTAWFSYGLIYQLPWLDYASSHLANGPEDTYLTFSKRAT